MDKPNLHYQHLAAWSGLAMLLLYGLCWGALAHGAPPVAPDATGEALAAFYAAHHLGILLGMSLAAVAGTLWMVWSAQVTIIMNRMEGAIPVLGLIQLSGGILTAWIVIFCPVLWAAAAFRTDLDPALVRLLSDLGFLVFNLTYMPTTLQAIATGLAGLADRSATPVFPRWVCHTVIWCGLANLPVTLVAFFTTGPFAWNGWINFPLPALAFYVWGITLSRYMICDARQRLASIAT